VENSVGEPYMQSTLSVNACAKQVVFLKRGSSDCEENCIMHLAVVDNPKAHQEYILCPYVCAVQVLEERMHLYKLHVCSLSVYTVHALFSKLKGMLQHCCMVFGR
jgi:hypothetical protein